MTSSPHCTAWPRVLPIPDPDSDRATLEVFDLDTHEWTTQDTYSDIPRMGQGSFFAIIGKSLYIYGGMNDEDHFDRLYQLDLESYHWRRLPDEFGPSPKAFGGMVAHENRLLMFAGAGSRMLRESEKGASFVDDKSFNHEFGTGWNNALHEFDTIRSELWMIVFYMRKRNVWM